MQAYRTMENAIIKFGYIEIEKQKLHQYKIPISIESVDINKIVAFNKVSFGKKDLHVSLARKMLRN